MFRVLYRWRVASGSEDRWIAAWSKVTSSMRSAGIGAEGSVLLRSRDEALIYLAIAEWKSAEAWSAYRKSESVAPEYTALMNRYGELLGVASFDLVSNLMGDAGIVHGSDR